jgi:hypothetical protein
LKRCDRVQTGHFADVLARIGLRQQRRDAGQVAAAHQGAESRRQHRRDLGRRAGLERALAASLREQALGLPERVDAERLDATIVALREQCAGAFVGEQLARDAAGVQTFTDSTPCCSAARTAVSASRRSPRPAHSASPSCSRVSSAFSSANESVCLPSANPAERIEQHDLRNAQRGGDRQTGKAGNAAPGGTASTLTRRRRMRAHTASRSRSASSSSRTSSSDTTGGV